MDNFLIQLRFEKIDNNNYTFYGLGSKKNAKYKYIVPNSIREKIIKFHIIYQIFYFSSIALLLPLSFKFKLQCFVFILLLFSIIIWAFVIYYLLRNCEKEPIEKL